MGSSSWSWRQNKAFETALATYTEDCADRWEKIAAAVPAKTVEEVKHHYKLLVKDIDNIESGQTSLPYRNVDMKDLADDDGKGKRVEQSGNSHKKREGFKGNGQAWTLNEHRWMHTDPTLH